ncbi:MAG: cysteine synthase A [Clostridiales bacterium]|jgi:cysteine synthase A|nr:cysteine synthase A [Clostridiales bacterium]
MFERVGFVALTCGRFQDLIGNTPMLRLAKIEETFSLQAAIMAKLEFFNPAGSVKDRVAFEMISDAERRDNLKPGYTIIEPTSGNTGIGIAAVAATKGYRVILTMPESMSIERRKLLAAHGAEIVLTDASLGMQGAVDKAEELSRAVENSFILNQFSNPANPRAHFQSTGVEIFEQTNGLIDMLVAGVGTGGTITGAGEYLKMKKPCVKIAAVEPSSSPVLSGGKAGAHKIQGIGAGFVPETLNKKIIDDIITVGDEDAFESCALISKKEGLLVGISSGAALHAAVSLAQKQENRNKLIVVIFPDSGERYLSSPIFGR